MTRPRQPAVVLPLLLFTAISPCIAFMNSGKIMSGRLFNPSEKLASSSSIKIPESRWSLSGSALRFLGHVHQGTKPPMESAFTKLRAQIEMNAHTTVDQDRQTSLPGMDRVLFIETGFGADQHGQNVTKAAIRACRNAIEFNSIPSIAALLPGGYADMRLRVSLALPLRYAGGLDLEAVRRVFPYGDVEFTIQEGGCALSSGIALANMGDVGDNMLVVAAHVAVGSGNASSTPLYDAEEKEGADRTDSVEDMVRYVRQVQERTRGSKQTWIAIVGGPGSGKSTVAEWLQKQLETEGVPTSVVPMDGYHYYKRELDSMPNPDLFHARRGAHWTFNASKLLVDLRRARESGAGVFPAFDHAVADPTDGAVTVGPDHEVVLVEGLYLALRQVAPWRAMGDLFDETWFVEGEERVLRERVILRNSAAWGLSRQKTAARVDANDLPNLRLVQSCRPFADRRIRVAADTKPLTSNLTPPSKEGTSAAMAVTKMDGMRQALFIETGFGADQVGLDPTKAASRACRCRDLHTLRPINAIEFNSLPCIRELMTDGYDDMLIRVTLCLPGQFFAAVDMEELRRIFPYGTVDVALQEGGGLFLSGERASQKGEERLDWMLVAIAHVVVGVADR